ncbi:MAG: hypothetical protein FWG79_01650 [Bacteroidales bacterium]|nr:hypothetical protein [Bacteroidales bacterium]
MLKKSAISRQFDSLNATFRSRTKQIIVVLATSCSTLTFAQIAPVSSRTTFTPPYSAQISEWSEKISLTLLLRDLSVTNGQVFVRLFIESPTVSLETRPLFGSRNFQLDGGVPFHISGSELSNLFQPENLVFTGMTRENFIRNGSRLPEGRYKLWFEVYEWGSRVKVSASEGFATINLHDIEPPILNFPGNNALIHAETPQNIMFSWTPRHQSAVSSGFQGVYDFEMVQIPQHYNGDLRILFETAQKYSEKTLFQTQFRYGNFDEELIKNQRYAFRVRVRSIDDDNESFQLKNNGYSEIFSFRYAEKCEKPMNFQGFSESPYSANLSWTVDDFKNEYAILYRRSDTDANAWFSQRTSFSEIQLEDLSPNQTYELKIRTLCEFTNSDDSESIFITTPEITNMDSAAYGCGKSFVPSDTCVKPLETLTSQDVFTSGGTTVFVQEVSGSGGIFSGKGYIQMPILSFIRLNVTFQNIRINECFQHTEGIVNVNYDANNNLLLNLPPDTTSNNKDQNDTTSPENSDQNTNETNENSEINDDEIEPEHESSTDENSPESEPDSQPFPPPSVDNTDDGSSGTTSSGTNSTHPGTSQPPDNSTGSSDDDDAPALPIASRLDIMNILNSLKLSYEKDSGIVHSIRNDVSYFVANVTINISDVFLLMRIRTEKTFDTIDVSMITPLSFIGDTAFGVRVLLKGHYNSPIFILVGSKTEEGKLYDYLKRPVEDLWEGEILLTNVQWISQFDGRVNGRDCHWCGTINVCCNGGLPCTNCSPCKGNNCCYQTCLVTIEQLGVTTNRGQSMDIATLRSNSKWQEQSDLQANVNLFNNAISYTDTILKSGKPVVIGVHYRNNKTAVYNTNKATFHFMVIVGKTSRDNKEYYRFYDPGRTNGQTATHENNLLEIDRGRNMIHGIYQDKPYTITEIRKNM